MSQMLKQARDVQKKIEEVQSELEDLEITAESGGGMIKVIVNGKQQLVELKISPEAIEEDIELLEDLIIAAVNEAQLKSNEESQNRMNAVTSNMLGGLKIPGMN